MTYNLPFGPGTTAISGSQRWRACLWVPRHKSILCRTAYWQCVDTVSITVTVTAVAVAAAVTWRPDEDRAQPVAALYTKQLTTSSALFLTSSWCIVYINQFGCFTQQTAAKLANFMPSMSTSSNYTVSQKSSHVKFSVTLSNLNQFSKFLHCWKAHEIC